MPDMTGAQALTRQLHSEGVDTVFALPGGQIMAAFDALYDQHKALRLVRTRHERPELDHGDAISKLIELVCAEATAWGLA